ncbi:hypothetical protein [Streptomyces sp. MBT84]|uniref:hypothetical protein n=1 Tax=Streptomyces sp. MBT84 TaxID=1488414 RepID=UPI001C6E4116|nr:hypothetical protein [Streptomyces sp. MBT84]
MAWLATTPRSSFGCCGPAIAELPLPPPSPALAHHLAEAGRQAYTVSFLRVVGLVVGGMKSDHENVLRS